jgi:hypothetical protein
MDFTARGRTTAATHRTWLPDGARLRPAGRPVTAMLSSLFFAYAFAFAKAQNHKSRATARGFEDLG